MMVRVSAGVMETPALAIRAQRTWDPVAGAVDGPAVVRVRNGVIQEIVAGAEPRTDEALTELGPDETLLPGLIDCHVHLCWDPAGDHVEDFSRIEDAGLEERVRRACAQLLAAGITCVRDLGDRSFVTLKSRDAIATRPWTGPEIFTAGPPITPPGGHCWFLGGETTPAHIEASVAARAERGVDVVKMMATGGKITPGSAPHESQYDGATLSRAVRAARHRSLPITAHAHGPDGIRDGVAAGMNGIEHCTFFTSDGIGYDERIVRRIAADGIAVSVPEATWHTTDELPLPPDPRLEGIWSNVVRMHRAGVPISISSDSDISPRKPHGVLARGAVRLTQHGMDAHDALLALTANPAAACGLDHRKARVAPGYDADLLVVKGDPITDISTLLHPVHVLRAGHRVATTAAARVATSNQEEMQ